MTRRDWTLMTTGEIEALARRYALAGGADAVTRRSDFPAQAGTSPPRWSRMDVERWFERRMGIGRKLMKRVRDRRFTGS